MERERILYILEYLRRNTDEQRCVSAKGIQSYLSAQTNLGTISALSIRRDIDSLILAGHHIEITRGAHNTFYFRMLRRNFTFNEIRFLVDSVSINQFLSAEQKQRLFRKFEELCSEAEVRKLISRISTRAMVPPSLDLLENLEQIHLILAVPKKIDFAYGKYNTQGQMVYYQKHREMIPCQVVYFGSRFYLKCVDEETGLPRTYRIDRMKDIVAGTDFSSKRPVLPKRLGAVMDIYDPERYEDVRLRVKRELLDDMLEQLGEFAHVRDDMEDTAYVLVRARIGISYGFYRWVMKYGDSVEILAPQSVRQTFREKLASVCARYDATE